MDASSFSPVFAGVSFELFLLLFSAIAPDNMRSGRGFAKDFFLESRSAEPAFLGRFVTEVRQIGLDVRWAPVSPGTAGREALRGRKSGLGEASRPILQSRRRKRVSKSDELLLAMSWRGTTLASLRSQTFSGPGSVLGSAAFPWSFLGNE